MICYINPIKQGKQIHFWSSNSHDIILFLGSHENPPLPKKTHEIMINHHVDHVRLLSSMKSPCLLLKLHEHHHVSWLNHPSIPSNPDFSNREITLFITINSHQIPWKIMNSPRFKQVNSPSTPSTRHCRAPTESPTQGLAGVDPREEIVFFS